MRPTLLIAALFAFGLSFAACDAFIDGIDDPLHVITSTELNDPDQVPFLVNGVLNRLAQANNNLVVQAGLLSDEFRFCRLLVQQCTFPTYEQLDEGLPLLDNTSVAAAWFTVSQHRFLADDLVRRAEEEMTFGGDQQALQRLALFTGYLHGALGRHNLATYFGLTENQGGGVLDGGPFIPSAELYAQAVQRYQSALNHADGAQETRYTNSLLARTHLYAGNWAQALAAAQNGLQQGDAPFVIQYALDLSNGWHVASGEGRVQAVVASRFEDPNWEWEDGTDWEDQEDPEPVDPRVPIALAPPTGQAINNGNFRFRQNLYAQTDNMEVITWQDTNLIRAEALVRTGGDVGVALTLINANRAAVGLDPLVGPATLGMIEQERDFEQFARGHRLPDQRRFNSWHLGPNTWRFLPIPLTERLNNPNID